MRTLGVAVASLLLTAGCHHNVRARDASVALPSPAESRRVAAGGICDVDPSACPGGNGVRAMATGSVAAEAYAVQQVSRRGSWAASLFGATTGSSSAAATPQLPSTASPSAALEMIEVEARLAIQVEDLAESAERFRTMVRAGGGTLTYDTATIAHGASEATFEVRVPMTQADKTIAALEGLGTVRAREIKASDVSKEYHDEELLLANQTAAMTRYEALLKTAANVSEVMEVERQLERLRAEIDRLKGDLAWTRDKVARATIRVRLFPSESAPEAVFAPEATLYPGIRATTLFDLRGESGRYGYAGAGLVLSFRDALGIHFGRALSIELDVDRAFGTAPPGSSYAYVALLGSDFYSDLLGAGRRTFLNPYLGWRLGYADSEGRGDLAVGAVVGLDLLKTKSVMLDLHARALALAGSHLGPHAFVVPGLSISVAF
jgi:hypothetical protein